MKAHLFRCLALLFVVGSSSAQVHEWVIAKGATYEQTADNTPPGAPLWSIFINVDTVNPTDATSVTISGGSIVGSIPLIFQDDGWELNGVFPSQAAMNGFLASNMTYTFTLSGGMLGTLVQSAPLGPEVYPNAPYLTGTSWSDALTTNSAVANTLTWNNPGAIVAASGATIFQVYDDDDDLVNEWTPGGTTSGTISAGLLDADTSYEGGLIFANLSNISGTGGFGIDGLTGHITLMEFPVETIPAAEITLRNAGSNPASYSAGLARIGQPWFGSVDLTTTGHSHAQVLGYFAPANLPLGGGQVLLIGGPKLFALPLQAGPIASWNGTIPNDLTLAGVTVYTQAVHILGVTPFALSNAQDLTLGS